MTESAMLDIDSGTSQYSDEDRRQAAILYAIHGKVTKVAELLSIPRQTIDQWKRTDWWNNLYGAIQQEESEKCVARLAAIASQAFDEIDDRLTYGDHKVVAGELTRVPVGAKDLSVITAISIDKRQLLLSRPTSIRGNTDGMAALAAQFEQLAQQSRERSVVSDQ